MGLRYFGFTLVAIFCSAFCEEEIKAQTYNDGPVQLQLRIRRINVTCPSTDASLTIGSQTGFSPDEFTFKVWARDNANIGPTGWQGGNCLQSNFNPPANSADFNTTLFNWSYSTVVVPKYLDLRLEAWENDCGSDGFCSGNRCSYSDSCCCISDTSGCLQSDGDDLHCDANPFITNLDYRLGPPGQWYNHGFITGGGCNNNCYQLEVETYWTSSNRAVVSGKAVFDSNGNCVIDSSELGIFSVIIKAEPGPFYTLSDWSGNYGFAFADTGNYTISVAPQQGFLEPSCTVVYNNIHITSLTDNIGNKDFVFLPYPCPRLSVDISSPLLRLCRDAKYIIRYCNTGMIAASNVFVEVKTDTFLSVNNSSLPWRIPQFGNVYLFDVGNVGAQECGTFTINVTVSCSAPSGQTHCVSAHIYPDDICVPLSTTWDSSSIQVSGRCANNDTVAFFVSNAGAGNMSDSLNYIIIEDTVMLLSKKFKLPSGAFIEDFVLANGSTFRLQAEQSAGHPGKSSPSVTIEGCGVNSFGNVSIGFVTILPQDDANPFISIDCQENIGAVDPNDKTGYPKGIRTEKIITSEFELEYKIRFQNTGMDTAFRVVIRDTLSPFLDIATVQPGSSSHLYEFRIFGPGILEWTFDNILLPDSNVNESESHGFVNFRVSQIDSNVHGTLIKNSADIYFDYNAPVKTNVEYHTVGDLFNVLWTVEERLEQHHSILLYPNPFSEYLIVELNTDPISQLSIEIYDIQGKLVRKFSSNVNHLRVTKLYLKQGMYFYRVITDENVVETGKIVGY